MYHKATITNFNFMPMGNGADSILRIWVEVKPSQQHAMIEEKGTIEQLSKKFQFIIQKAGGYNLEGLKGRLCNLIKTDYGYHFISFAD